MKWLDSIQICTLLQPPATLNHIRMTRVTGVGTFLVHIPRCELRSRENWREMKNVGQHPFLYFWVPVIMNSMTLDIFPHTRHIGQMAGQRTLRVQNLLPSFQECRIFEPPQQLCVLQAAQEIHQPELFILLIIKMRTSSSLTPMNRGLLV